MLQYQSKLFYQARKEVPAEATAPSHQLLLRAGYIDQMGSGLFTLLPLGWRVHEAVVHIIREEMVAIGGQELLLPALQPASVWESSGRLQTMDPPLFRLRDRHEKELVLASTHEEAITQLARSTVESYKDLPCAVFQIQTKFRNEIRATGGLLRVREFVMKDMYSFHRTREDLEAYYEQVRQAYLKIFLRCELTARSVVAGSGSIGGSVSHEFAVEAAAGEDRIVMCTACAYGANLDAHPDVAKPCPLCGGTLVVKNSIENGHIFQLGTTYSQPLQAFFTAEDGTRTPVEMGCYGIGVGRLVAAIVEVHHDDRGIRWPTSVSPFRVHVVPVQPAVVAEAEALAKKLAGEHDVLFDDRHVSAGQKFAEADLVGVSQRIVISEKTLASQSAELIARSGAGPATVPLNDLLKHLNPHA